MRAHVQHVSNTTHVPAESERRTRPNSSIPKKIGKVAEKIWDKVWGKANSSGDHNASTMQHVSARRTKSDPSHAVDPAVAERRQQQLRRIASNPEQRKVKKRPPVLHTVKSFKDMQEREEQQQKHQQQQKIMMDPDFHRERVSKSGMEHFSDRSTFSRSKSSVQTMTPSVSLHMDIDRQLPQVPPAVSRSTSFKSKGLADLCLSSQGNTPHKQSPNRSENIMRRDISTSFSTHAHLPVYRKQCEPIANQWQEGSGTNLDVVVNHSIPERPSYSAAHVPQLSSSSCDVQDVRTGGSHEAAMLRKRSREDRSPENLIGALTKPAGKTLDPLTMSFRIPEQEEGPQGHSEWNQKMDYESPVENAGQAIDSWLHQLPTHQSKSGGMPLEMAAGEVQNSRDKTLHIQLGETPSPAGSKCSPLLSLTGVKGLLAWRQNRHDA